MFIEVIANYTNSQITFEILMEFGDLTAVGNAGSLSTANLLPDSSTVYSVLYQNVWHYSTNRQVAGSVPDGVIGIFQ